MSTEKKSMEDILLELQELKKENALLKEKYETDFRERKQTEEALRESELKYRSLIESSSDAIFCVDEKGEYKFTNHLFASTFGKTPDYFIGKTFWDIYPKEHADYRYETTKRVFQSGKSESIEVEVPLPDKTLYFLATANPIKDTTGKVILNLTHAADITQRKHTEDEINKKNLELAELNAAKDKFFSIIAHDLRSPFNSFIGLTAIMSEDPFGFTLTELQELSKSMNDSAVNLYKLLENLLQWSSMQQGLLKFNPELCSLDSIVKENIKLASEYAKQKNIQLSNNICEGLKVRVDLSMLNSVFRNLISNAVKFTPENGLIKIAAVNNDGDLVIRVQDSGIGMDESEVSSLFKLDTRQSSRGTNAEEGTGLGLLLCKEFIEKHDGKIWVESEVGKGSTFYFTLPKVIEL